MVVVSYQYRIFEEPNLKRTVLSAEYNFTFFCTYNFRAFFMNPDLNYPDPNFVTIMIRTWEK